MVEPLSRCDSASPRVDDAANERNNPYCFGHHQPAEGASKVAFDPAESAASVLRGWAHAMLAHHHGREVYQTSTMGALLDGVYDGDVTIRELLRHGDFGLGTFNGLDGEMLVLDGVCYQLRSDGSAQVAESDQRTPFGVVTWFDA